MDKIRNVVPPYFSVAEMFGFTGIAPFKTVTKFVMLTMPPDGSEKFWQNAGAWVKEVTFVPDAPETAGLIATAAWAQRTELFVHDIETEAAPGWVLPAPHTPEVALHRVV